MSRLPSRLRSHLLGIARDSITEALKGARYQPPVPSEPELLEPSGAFVSLHRGGALRGCIGNFQSEKPLYRTVADMARAAAFEDPRFPPVGSDEYPELDLEISVLTPLERLDDPDRIEVGRHGLYVVHGFHRGVLLPQVPVQLGWDRTRFLEETCRKAGLPANAWRSGAELYVFEAEVFGEEDF